MPAKLDRRIQRTRSLLHRALIALVLEKGYGRVTVQDILDRADVGRSTFYAHYHSKDDLFLASGIEHLRAVLTTDDTLTPDAGQDATRLLAPVRTLFRLAEDNRPLYRALIGRRGSDLVVRQARTMLTQVLTEHLRAQLTVSDDTQLQMTVAFLVNGLLGLLVWWLDSNTPYSADEAYAHFERLATPGIQQLSGLSHHPERPPAASTDLDSDGATTACEPQRYRAANP